MMAKKKILVLGGAGYMGGCVTDLLKENGYPVTVYDSLLYETRFLKDVPFIHGDVRDKKKLSSIVNDFDVVIALAAIVGDEACEHNPVVTRAVNVESTKWLADNFKGKIIFASSCSVYGASNGVIHEESELNPLSLYAGTKVESENDLLQSKNKDRHVIFRFGTLFGIGDNHARMRFDLVVNVFTRNAAIGEPVRVFGGGKWRPIVHVKDAAGAILYAVSKDLSGVYNVSHKNYMVKDIAEAVQKVVSDKKVKVEYNNLKFEDLRNYRVSTKKFRALGWRSLKDLPESIEEIYARIREGRIKDPEDKVYSNAAFIKSRII